MARAIPRTVFHPVPNVDSVLGRADADRTGLAARAAALRRRRVRAPPQGARALAGAGQRRRDGGIESEAVRAALVELGLPAGCARRAPRRRRSFAAWRGWSALTRRSLLEARPRRVVAWPLPRRAGPGEDQPRPVPRRRSARTAATSLSSVMQSISLADELTLRSAPARRGVDSGATVGPPVVGGDVVVCPGVRVRRPRTSRRARSRRSAAATGWDAPALRAARRQARPGRGRPGRRLGRRRGRAAPRRGGLGARRPRRCSGAAARARRRRARAGAPGTLAGQRRGRALAALPDPRRPLRGARPAVATRALDRGGVRRGGPDGLARGTGGERGRGCARGGARSTHSPTACPLPAAELLSTTCRRRPARSARDRRRARAGRGRPAPMSRW